MTITYDLSFSTSSGATLNGTVTIDVVSNSPVIVSAFFTGQNTTNPFNYTETIDSTNQYYVGYVDDLSGQGSPQLPTNTFELTFAKTQDPNQNLKIRFTDPNLDGNPTLDTDNTFYWNNGAGDFGTIDPSSATFAIACFTPDTLISTPTGSTPVQDLQIGDLILNHLGQAVPVKWIGRQQIHPAFAGESLPICIKQGALGNDLPARDLYVSPGHALYIDNCLLIDAKALVNGTTITQVTQWEGDVQYLHIETEHHEIILAEGTPAETFMDNVSRTCFNNYSEYESLYPQATEMIELDIPRVSHQRQLPNALKAKLAAISEVLMGEDRIKERMVG